MGCLPASRPIPDLQCASMDGPSDKAEPAPMLVFLSVLLFLLYPPPPLILLLCLYLCLSPRSPAPDFTSSAIYIGHGARLELAKCTLARSGYGLHFGPFESANVSMSHCEFVDAKFARCSYPACTCAPCATYPHACHATDSLCSFSCGNGPKRGAFMTLLPPSARVHNLTALQPDQLPGFSKAQASRAACALSVHVQDLWARMGPERACWRRFAMA